MRTTNAGGVSPSGNCVDCTPKLLWHPLIIVRRVVDHDRQQERFVRRYTLAAIDHEVPFESEVPLGALMGVFRDDG